MIKFFAGILIPSFLLTFHAHGQDKVELFKKRYPQTDVLFLHQSTSVKITNEKGKLKILSKHSESLMPLNDNGLMHNSKTIGTSSFVEVTDVKASVMVPNKSSYKNIKVTDIVLKADMGQESFYDDSKSYNFTYPQLAIGAKTQLDYTITYHDPHFFGSYFFGNYVAVDSSELTIETAKGIDLYFTEFNFEGHNIQYTKTEKSKSVIHKWTALRMPKIEVEDNAPNPRYYIPHIVLRVSGYQNGDSYVNFLKSPKELYEWYADLVKLTNKDESKDLQKITDSLTAGAANDEEKVKRIFYWVQDKIAYVAIEDGLGGFIPRDASLVFSRRYGDCKDMASLLTQMMKYAGIKSYLTWIGTRDIPYTYNQVPTPSSDNHMIASWKDEAGKVYFLDATGKHHPFGYPSSMIQGKEALLGISPEVFEIVKVPEVDAYRNTTEEVIDVYLDKDVLIGTSKITLTGFEKSYFKSYDQYYNYAEKVNFMKRLFPKGSNKLMIDTLLISDGGKEMPLIIDYTFRIPGYAKMNQNEMYVNLNLDKSFIGTIVKDDRKVDLEFEHKMIAKSTLRFRVPKEYKLQSFPKDMEKTENEYRFKTNYKVEGDLITLSNEFQLSGLDLKKKNFGNWNNFVNAYVLNASETIVLKK